MPRRTSNLLFLTDINFHTPPNSYYFTISSPFLFHAHVERCGLGQGDLIVIPMFHERNRVFEIRLDNVSALRIQFKDELDFLHLEFIWKKENVVSITCYQKYGELDLEPFLTIDIENGKETVKVMTYNDSKQETPWHLTLREDEQKFIAFETESGVLSYFLIPLRNFMVWIFGANYLPSQGSDR